MISFMFSAHDIAIYIINWCHDNEIAITNLKLQKLLYFVQGEFSRERGIRLIREDFYAWQLGPVIPEVYAEYSIFSSCILPTQKPSILFCQQDLAIIDRILKKYASKPTWTLVDLSHQQDPWKYTYEVFGGHTMIPYQSIADFFGSDQYTCV